MHTFLIVPALALAFALRPARWYVVGNGDKQHAPLTAFFAEVAEIAKVREGLKDILAATNLRAIVSYLQICINN